VAEVQKQKPGEQRQDQQVRGQNWLSAGGLGIAWMPVPCAPFVGFGNLATKGVEVGLNAS
jgi:hypothetical protein